MTPSLGCRYLSDQISLAPALRLRRAPGGGAGQQSASWLANRQRRPPRHLQSPPAKVARLRLRALKAVPAPKEREGVVCSCLVFSIRLKPCFSTFERVRLLAILVSEVKCLI